MRRSREGGGRAGTGQNEGRGWSADDEAGRIAGQQDGKTCEEIWSMIDMCQTAFRHPLHGHSYTRFTTLRPRVCHTCEGPIWGPFSHACHCLACGLVIHRQCAMQITKAPCGKFRGKHRRLVYIHWSDADLV